MALYLVGLGAEFNSASNSNIFKGGHRAKNGGLTPNTGVATSFERYSLFGFAIQLGLFRKDLGLGAELNSASNPTSFELVHNAKVGQILEILSFPTDFEVFRVRIHCTTWVISERTWDRCGI